jgi:hypothetical protein
MGIHFVKDALPLQKPLDDLAEEKLLPFEVKMKEKIDNEDVVAELGTEDYLVWGLEDMELATGDPARYVMIFITYYTGDPGQVPHVPEVCYVGSGNVISKREESHIYVPEGGSRRVEIPLKILSISDPQAGPNGGRKVAYFFSANGSYVNSRNQVRYRLNNWFDTHAYFCKVEMTFWRGGALTTERVVKAAEKLAAKLVPVLRADHWPIWPVEASKQAKEKRK